MRSADDEMLIRRTQAGDAQAFDALFRKYQTTAYNFALRLSHNHEEASDLVSEGFIRVARSISSFKFHCAFSSWLYRILSNCHLDNIQKACNRASSSSLDAEVGFGDGTWVSSLADHSASPYEALQYDETTHAIEIALAKLSSAQRTLIVMQQEEMKSIDEIAGTLHVPVGTIKSRLHRARTSLREMIAGAA